MFHCSGLTEANNPNVRALIVWHLVEWSHPTPEIRGSNPVIDKSTVLTKLNRRDEIKEKKSPRMTQLFFKKQHEWTDSLANAFVKWKKSKFVTCNVGWNRAYTVDHGTYLGAGVRIFHAFGFIDSFESLLCGPWACCVYRLEKINFKKKDERHAGLLD